MKWMIGAARKRNEKTMDAKLAAELWLLIRKKVLLIRKNKILIEWQKQIKHFHTLDFN
jgi:ribosomal protein S7